MPKSIVVFRYFVDRPVSRQPPAPKTSRYQNKRDPILLYLHDMAETDKREMLNVIYLPRQEDKSTFLERDIGTISAMSDLNRRHWIWGIGSGSCGAVLVASD